MWAKIQHLEGKCLNKVEVVPLSQFNHGFKDGKFNKDKKYPLITGKMSDGKDTIIKVRIFDVKAVKDDFKEIPIGRKRMCPNRFMESDEGSFSGDDGRMNTVKKAKTGLSSKSSGIQSIEDGHEKDPVEIDDTQQHRVFIPENSQQTGDEGVISEINKEGKDHDGDDSGDPLNILDSETLAERNKPNDTTVNCKAKLDDEKIPRTSECNKISELKISSKQKPLLEVRKDRNIQKVNEAKDVSSKTIKNQKLEIIKLQKELEKERKYRKDLNDKYEKVLEENEIVSELNRNLQNQILDRFRENDMIVEQLQNKAEVSPADNFVPFGYVRPSDGMLHLGSGVYFPNKTYTEIATSSTSPYAFVSKMLLKVFHIVDLKNATISGNASNKTVAELKKLEKALESMKDDEDEESEEIQKLQEKIKNLKEKIESTVQIDEGKLFICKRCYELWLKNIFHKPGENDAKYSYELYQFETHVGKKVSYLKGGKQRSKAGTSNGDTNGESSNSCGNQNELVDDEPLSGEYQESITVSPEIQNQDTPSVKSTDTLNVSDEELSDIDGGN